MRTLLLAALVCLGLFGNPAPALTQTWYSTGAPNNRWYSLACSADGTKLVATVQQYPYLYASTNSGSTWFLNGAPSNNWISVASSADGVKLVAAAAVIYNPAGGLAQGGPIYTSADSGSTWQLTTAPSNQWSCVASSADASTLVAAAAYNTSNTEYGLIYLSTNSGASWAATTAPADRWYSVAASADGRRLLAGGAGVFTSADSGATWNSNNIPWDFHAGTPLWPSLASSADGTTIVAIRQLSVYTGGDAPRVYISTNFGSAWISNTLPNVGRGYVASSADGSRLMASMGHLYISANSGVSWMQQNIPGQTYGWGSGSVASSADGMKLFLALGADDFGQPNSIYTRYSPPTPRLNIARSGSSLILSWIVPATNFVLLANSDFTTTNWLTVTNTATLDPATLQDQVIVSASGFSSYYRLVTP